LGGAGTKDLSEAREAIAADETIDLSASMPNIGSLSRGHDHGSLSSSSWADLGRDRERLVERKALTRRIDTLLDGLDDSILVTIVLQLHANLDNVGK
jgi:hypothetical protein